MLLRYFVNFYDMEIIEEEAFLAWKEDITQEFPGKGKALFQVLNFGACYDTFDIYMQLSVVTFWSMKTTFSETGMESS